MSAVSSREWWALCIDDFSEVSGRKWEVLSDPGSGTEPTVDPGALDQLFS